LGGWYQSGQVVSDRDGFQSALLKHLGDRAWELPELIETMRRYRDKFVAPLDTDLVMQVPMLDTAQSAVWFYHAYLVRQEATSGQLAGLADRPGSTTLEYNQCVEEAHAIILRVAHYA
jgi:hypothetical protein